MVLVSSLWFWSGCWDFNVIYVTAWRTRAKLSPSVTLDWNHVHLYLIFYYAAAAGDEMLSSCLLLWLFAMHLLLAVLYLFIYCYYYFHFDDKYVYYCRICCRRDRHQVLICCPVNNLFLTIFCCWVNLIVRRIADKYQDAVIILLNFVVKMWNNIYS